MKPILFNTEMVKAILNGTKTQTRRLVKGLPLYSPYFEVVDGAPMVCDDNGDWYPATAFSRIQPGDVLWVRETWHGLKTGNEKFGYHKTFWYKADEKDDNPDDKWRPSIHMPKEAARLFLRVKSVRIERLQDMTPDECINDGGFTREAVNLLGIAPLFGALWDNTLKSADIPKYGWFANPWVWVIEFERVNREDVTDEYE